MKTLFGGEAVECARENDNLVMANLRHLLGGRLIIFKGLMQSILNWKAWESSWISSPQTLRISESIVSSRETKFRSNPLRSKECNIPWRSSDS